MQNKLCGVKTVGGENEKLKRESVSVMAWHGEISASLQQWRSSAWHGEESQPMAMASQWHETLYQTNGMAKSYQ
jgi:hypothetical protein